MEIALSAMLLTRLKSTVLKKKKIMFLIGSGCSLPEITNGPGVPSAQEIVNDIKQIFVENGDSEVYDEFFETIQGDINDYQKATQALVQGFGQDEVNNVIIKAVLKSRITIKYIPNLP
ncbi:hypothetical protein FHW88_000201 [Mucilaginibacter sp. SG538B]|uniref:hypothetical protein n=1 Tax=Mucilaginibacter sp. SG538B TaxID=2587021 RepID=UPI00159D11FE|nr:hypothetical protein [Mucilaginibacter sp. SG538B]NVM61925.1 hypothetical protein [Mucilaginibacter sp. SG538B]